jgi:hypothetical protein
MIMTSVSFIGVRWYRARRRPRYNRAVQLSFRRVAGRFVLAAGVCAAVILVLRGNQSTHRGVTFVVDPRPLGASLRHLDVTIEAGDAVLGAWQSGEPDPARPLQPLRLTTPVPSGEVTITLDVLATDGAHRVVHHARPVDGATVEIVLGATE